MDDGGRGMRAGCIRIRCPSPRRIVSRWFSPHGKDKGKKKKKTQIEEVTVRDCKALRIRSCSDDDSNGVGDDTTPRIIDSDLRRREFLFSIGVSCYLLHLIDTGREEIHKIVQLRKELEKFLECRNEDLRRNQQGFSELQNNIERFLEFDNDDLRRKQQKQEQSVTSAYSTTTDVLDGPDSSTDQYYSPQIPERSMNDGVERSLQSHYGGDDFGGEMDQLEAELEAELELLQIGQDQDSKLKEDPEKSENSEHVEEQQGVCPYELERRLHELIETRQQEEIKELEIALEDAKQKLHLKKTEASW